MTGVSKKVKRTTTTTRRPSVSDIAKMMDKTGIKTEDEELEDFLKFLKKDKAKSPKKSPGKKMSISPTPGSPSKKKRNMDIIEKAWDKYEFSQMTDAFQKHRL